MLSTTEHHYIIASLHHDDFMLRLSLQKLENQNFFPIKIEIFKIKTPLPIQLPS
jgi:hypothetical protein